MPHPRRTVMLAALSLLLAAGTARADAESRLGLTLVTTVSGAAHPEIVLNPADAMQSFEADLVDTAGGKGQTLRCRALKAGSRKALTIRQGTGTTAWKAEVTVVWRDGGRDRFALTFSTTRVGKLAMTMGPDDVDLAGRRLAARATNPIRRLDLEIVGPAGRLLHREHVDFDPPVAPGEPAAITWDAVDGEIVQMKVKVTDVADFWAGMQVSPFSVDIPHEEVEFESGSAEIRASEVPKLEKTLTAIGSALQKYRDLPGLQLYVGGYTDTVGDAASNRALSKARATAIGRWFAGRGLRLGLLVQGFGEDVLAVTTADETAEARNRRAVYILSTYAPTGRDVPTSAWTRL
jgi:outer membrane protein OmpA-like peptidoglycan-associated protein